MENGGFRIKYRKVTNGPSAIEERKSLQAAKDSWDSHHVIRNIADALSDAVRRMQACEANKKASVLEQALKADQEERERQNNISHLGDILAADVPDIKFKRRFTTNPSPSQFPQDVSSRQ